MIKIHKTIDALHRISWYMHMHVRTLMPMTKEMLNPRHNTEEERRKIEKTKDKQAYYYNQNLCSSNEIMKVDKVRIRKPT